jgi:carboxymethylenebutenolidase
MNPNVSLTTHDIATTDGICDAHLAVPAGPGNYPGVLFFMDAFGVRPVIDEWIKRIAANGYTVLAPNLFYRNARSPIVEDVLTATSEDNRAGLFRSLMPMMQVLTPDVISKDTKAFVEFLHSLPNASSGRVGVTGYCMGSRYAIHAAAVYPDKVAAVAGFHGGNLATDQPDSAHLVVGRLKAEVYLACADHDGSAPPEQQERMKNALTEAGITHTLVVYVDAPHGYTMSDTASYREDAAERHFKNLIELLDRNLK